MDGGSVLLNGGCVCGLVAGVVQAAIAGGGEEEEGAGQAPGLFAGTNREVRVVRRIVFVGNLMVKQC